MENLRLAQNHKPDKSSGPTSSVSLIVPPKTSLSDLRQMVKTEYQTASNIKSSCNRKSVQNSLSKISQFLKSLKAIPETGIALYSEQCI